MKILTEPLKELECFKSAEYTLRKKGNSALISGCVDSEKWNMTHGLSERFKDRIIVTYSDNRIKEIYDDYRIYDKNVRMYPAKDVIFYQADVHSNTLVRERLLCLKRIINGLPGTYITTFNGLMNVGADLLHLKKNTLKLSVGAIVSLPALSKKLTSMGYEKNYQVETGGQFAIRGDIVDIFDLTEDEPVRIEFWGDEITGIRNFDVESQRSSRNLESIKIYPANELPLSESELLEGLKDIEEDGEKLCKKFRKNSDPESAHRLETIIREISEEITEFPWSFNADGYINYFCEERFSFCDLFDDALFIIDEPLRVFEHADGVEAEFKDSMKARLEKGYIVPKQANLLFSKDEILSKISAQNVLYLASMEPRTINCDITERLYVSAKSIPPYSNDFMALVKDITAYKKKGYRVVLLSGSKTRAQRLAGDLQYNDIPAFFSENRDGEVNEGEVVTMYGNVLRGFEYPDIKFVVISETDIFKAEKKKKKVKRYEGNAIRDFNDLHIGDYVVHEHYGVGIYRGIETVEASKVSKDYMKIEYRDNGILYVPATSLEAVMKYASQDAKKPKLNKLGTQEWTKTKTRVREAVDEIAGELVDLYAKRSIKEGYAFSKDTVWQQEFEELFPYDETKDQLEAIEATKQDMESTKIMDRLICGDVGYGKTEVAIRAAFKAVQDGKQVALLVPTTILAQQHYNTFVQRMKDFPVKVELMSRFVPKSAQDKTVKELKSGMVDIVIGTHRILSKDIEYKNLGLLIVDEEQRFGVSHKEKIKHLKENVDVLTLTATPIPRTLHMSLVGIRDMSVLEEPPGERLPIQTYVCEYNEEMVREAINRELTRGGQVYYVYNRVNSIAEVASKVQALVPDAVVAFAHGQMKETELERIMYDFISGEIDVLVSTTIIETGIDIPNVNTLIVHDSENLGLSQLYQLRGRVGRSNRNAYAFLMYKRDKILTEVAEKRLQTIRDFTDLGSGFKIAMKDLEIRGAGNVLGMSQSGHMEAVGYDLYCKLLNKAVMKLKGETVKEDFTTVIDLDVDAYISPDYILNELQKLDTYKRIAGLETEEEVKEMADELLDRFGPVPESVQHLLDISWMRIVAHRLYITEVKGKNGKITFEFRPDADIRVENIGDLMLLYRNHLSFERKGTPSFSYNYRLTGEVLTDEKLLMENTTKILKDMVELLQK